MGNSNKEAKIYDYGPYNVCIQMDKTKFYLGDKITGNIVIHYNRVINMGCMIYVKVFRIRISGDRG